METSERAGTNGGDGGGASEEDALLLGVRGYTCEVFDEPATAWALHQETHLIPWRGDASGLRIDRFDARNLLDDRAQFRQLKKKTSKRKFESISAPPDQSGGGDGGDGASDGGDAVDSELSALLHRLRYGDYAVEFPDEQLGVSVAENRFPYRYPEDDAAADDGEEEEADGDAFVPTFRVPDGVQAPKTLKRHAIVKATADKVRGNAQLEVMMKVRLGDNAKFAFLRPESRLHAYYCFLRDQNPQEGLLKAPASAGFLLLGAEYEDSDDEDKDPPSNDPKSIDVPSSK